MAVPAVCEQLKHEFPDWDFFGGVVAGLLYAKRPKSSPPKVVRAPGPGELAEKIREAEDPLYWHKALQAREAAIAELGERVAQHEEFGAHTRLRPVSGSPPRWPGGLL